MSSSRQIRSRNMLTIEEIQKAQDESDSELVTETTATVKPIHKNSTLEEEVNKKLSDVGVLEEGMSLEEKTHLLAFINESYNTAQAEEKQRKYERKEEIATSVTISENKGHDPLSAKTKQIVRDWKNTSSESLPSNEPIDIEDDEDDKKYILEKLDAKTIPLLKDSAGKEVSLATESTPEKIRKTSTDNVERSISVDCKDKNSNNNDGMNIKSTSDTSSDESSDILSTASAKKRHTSTTPSNEILKRFKTESSNNLNNETPSPNSTKKRFRPLAIEIYLEKEKQKSNVYRRSKKIICLEVEQSQKNWRESHSKIKVPVIWGKPICPKGVSAILNGSIIPPLLLTRYRKFLISKNLTHPVFLPAYLQKTQDDLSDVIFDSSELGSQSSNVTVDKSPPLGDSDCLKIEDSVRDSETSANNFQSKRVNNRIVYKEDSSPPSEAEQDEWLSTSSNKRKNCKNKGNKNLGKKGKKGARLVGSPVKQPIQLSGDYNHKESQSSRTDILRSQNPFGSSEASTSESGKLTRSRTKRIQSPVPETVVPCPVCSQPFSSLSIENHAAECASKTYAD